MNKKTQVPAMSQELRKMQKEIDTLKKDVELLKKNKVDDAHLTPFERNEVNKALKEFRQGKGLTLSKLKKELGLRDV